MHGREGSRLDHPHLQHPPTNTETPEDENTIHADNYSPAHHLSGAGRSRSTHVSILDSTVLL